MVIALFVLGVMGYIACDIAALLILKYLYKDLEFTLIPMWIMAFLTLLFFKYGESVFEAFVFQMILLYSTVLFFFSYAFFSFYRIIRNRGVRVDKFIYYGEPGRVSSYRHSHGRNIIFMLFNAPPIALMVFCFYCAYYYANVDKNLSEINIMLNVFSRFFPFGALCLFMYVLYRPSSKLVTKPEYHESMSSRAQERFIEDEPWGGSKPDAHGAHKTVGSRSIIIDRGSNLHMHSFDDKKTFQMQIREVFHSLLTPARTITNAVSIIDKSRLNANYEDVLSENLRILTNNSMIITSLLYAYRGIAFSMDYSDSDISISIKSFIEETVRSLNVQLCKDIGVRVDESNYSIDGYSKNLVIALLLPLIQNAVEASPGGGIVEVCTVDDINFLEIIIINRTTDTVCISDLQNDYFSTKNGDNDSHEGIGLTTVRKITSNMQIGFELDYKDNTFSAKLKFPKRRNNDD